MYFYSRATLIYKLKRKIAKLLGKTTQDDFDWKSYTEQYRWELKSDSKEFNAILKNGEYAFIENKLVKVNDNCLPLHPNHRLIYETIMQLKPKSVFELGCGGGDLLHNIGLLAREITKYGVDLSDEQLGFLKERHPQLNAIVNQYDCTLPFPSTFPHVDVAYTQAVLMHIQLGNGHMIALSNLFRVATKQVILMENWTRHDFMADIKKLHALKIIPWSEIYFYYRDSDEFKKPHLMIVSSVPLQQYNPLLDFVILRDGVGK